jgi:ferrochelatase
VIDRWGTHPLLVDAFINLIQKELDSIDPEIRDQVIILFSAHSLPLRVRVLSSFIKGIYLFFVYLQF